MNAADKLDRLAEVVGARRDLDQRMTDLDTERDQLIRELMAAGARIPVLMETTGLSRPRIYQIRDGRR